MDQVITISVSQQDGEIIGKEETSSFEVAEKFLEQIKKKIKEREDKDVWLDKN